MWIFSQDLVKFLLKCGDYSLQEIIMETFTRLTPQTSRESGCRSLFEKFPSDAQQAFIDFGKVVFQVVCIGNLIFMLNFTSIA
jgi:hypothetical protein